MSIADCYQWEKLGNLRLIALNRWSFHLIETEGRNRRFGPDIYYHVAFCRVPVHSSPCMGLRLSECGTIRGRLCLRVCGWNMQVCLRVCCTSEYIPSSEASLDVRLPTNPLLNVRVSLLVPGSGNTPIKAVLHGHANSFGQHAEAEHDDRVWPTCPALKGHVTQSRTRWWDRENLKSSCCLICILYNCLISYCL